jgi:ferritin-like metal-binding protein YciE
MLEKLHDRDELFTYKLGATLKMENTVVDMLDRLQGAAQSDQLKGQLRHHQDETRQQIMNLERAFSLMGEEPERHTDLVIEAIDKEGLLQVKRSDEGVVDQVILAGAADTEHHEIAVYDWLITSAEAQGRNEVAGLLRENLEMEQHTLEEVQRAAKEFAQQASARPS